MFRCRDKTNKCVAARPDRVITRSTAIYASLVLFEFDSSYKVIGNVEYGHRRHNVTTILILVFM
jgi:hypothetical protein